MSEYSDEVNQIRKKMQTMEIMVSLEEFTKVINAVNKITDKKKIKQLYQMHLDEYSRMKMWDRDQNNP